MEWLLSVAVKKVLARLAVLVAAKASAVGLEHIGVTLSINPDALTVAFYGGYEGLRNWLKVKKGWSWL